MLKQVLFLIIVLLTNIIQGITGFAGTILAMPASVLLVGYETAKPILNILGILAGLYVVVTSYRHIDRKEFFKIVSVMFVGIVGGIFLKTLFTGSPSLFYKILGAVVLGVAFEGIYKLFIKKGESGKTQKKAVSYLILIASGIVHGMFVCGGPLLVAYLAGRIKDKQVFRATVSAVWVVLNTVVMFDDIRSGYFNPSVLLLLAVSSAVLFLGMALGSVLYKKMSREVFMKITYILLVISGALMFIK